MSALTCVDVRDLAPVYVLGALERDEELAVTQHLATCTDAHLEIAQLAEITPYLDEMVPIVEPPAALRGRILAAAADELATRRAAPESAGPTGRAVAEDAKARARPTSADRVVSLGAARARRRDWRGWAAAVAAAFVIVALGAWNVVTQQQLSDARSYQQRLTAAIAQAAQPGSQVAVLAATTPGASPGGIAVLPANGNGTLVMSGLTPTSGSQVYEAWAIAEGQPPAPVAGFVVGTDGIGYLDRMPAATGQAITVAITLEPKPNPSAPTSTPIAAGVASKSGGAG